MDAAIAYVFDHFWKIATYVSAAALGAHLATRNARAARRASASSQFRLEVLGALSALYPTPVSWPENIDDDLRSAFPQLQRAVEVFRPFVPWWRRRAFDRAWFEYHCSTGRSVDSQVYHHYMAFASQPNHRHTFERNVSRLLSFATET